MQSYIRWLFVIGAVFVTMDTAWAQPTPPQRPVRSIPPLRIPAGAPGSTMADIGPDVESVPVVRELLGGPTPEVTYREIMERLKSEQNALIVLDYVYWPEALQKLTEKDKERLRVSTPDSLRRYVEDSLANPNIALMKRALRSARAETLETKSVVLRQLRSIEAQRRTSVKTDEFSDLRFELGTVTYDGDRAKMEVTLIKKLDSQNQTVSFIRVDQRWMLDTLQIVNQPIAFP